MKAKRATLEQIEGFLAQKRIAMVGVSRDAKHFSITLMRTLVARGYDVVPVNPCAKEIEGRACFPRVQDVEPPVECALLMTPAGASEAVVNDCAEAGVKRLWMYSAGAGGAVSERALLACERHQMNIIPGECPFMFLPNPGFHKVHAIVKKITGTYPKHEDAGAEVRK